MWGKQQYQFLEQHIEYNIYKTPKIKSLQGKKFQIKKKSSNQMIFYYSGVFTFGGITLENLYASSLTPAFLKTLLLIKKWVDLHMRAL